MGMAPTPDQLERQRKLAQGIERGGAPRSMVEGDIPPLSPLKKSEVSMLIHGIAWTYQKRILDHIEVLTNNDRTWEIVRRAVMGLMTEQVESTQKIIGQKVRELQMKAKEIADEEHE